MIRNLRTALAAVKADLRDLVKVTVYATDLRYMPQIDEVRRRHFTESLPISTLLEVRKLSKPEYLVEIDGIASSHDRRRRPRPGTAGRRHPLWPHARRRERVVRVAEGEFVTLLGPSGGGKTSTLRIVAGFLLPDEGRVLLRGERVDTVPPYERDIGMVFQNYALFPHMTVADNVGFGLRMRRVGRREIAPRVEEALALVRLEGYGAAIRTSSRGASSSVSRSHARS